MENVIRNTNFSIKSHSQEATINYRHGIFIGDNFHGITKVKPGMICNALVQNISEDDWQKDLLPRRKM